jgi:hypothetical protein
MHLERRVFGEGGKKASSLRAAVAEERSLTEAQLADRARPPLAQVKDCLVGVYMLEGGEFGEGFRSAMACEGSPRDDENNVPW